LTGLRWIEVKNLLWNSGIDLKNRKMIINQSKTGRDKVVSLNDTAIQLLGKPSKTGTLAFNILTANGANKTLKAWVKRAGIEKKITWHNARHSTGTNMTWNGENILTVASQLGHTTTRHTLRYVKDVEEMKQRATDKLTINL